jgi:hypothetical protein
LSIFLEFPQKSWSKWLSSRYFPKMLIESFSCFAKCLFNFQEILVQIQDVFSLITSSSWYQKMNAGDSSGPRRIVHVRLIVEPFWT